MTIKEFVSEISVNTQSSIHIDHEGFNIYFDPIEMKHEEHDADVIFFTHAHYDHYSPDDFRKLMKEDTLFIAPASMAGDLEKDGLTNIRYMHPNDVLDIGTIRIKAIPAYNDIHRRDHDWLGYLLNIDGLKLYNTGDTGANKETEKVKTDIILLPIGGTFTMDALQAAELVNKMHPQVAIPIHYGSIVGNPKDADVFEAHVNKDIKVVRKLKF